MILLSHFPSTTRHRPAGLRSASTVQVAGGGELGAPGPGAGSWPPKPSPAVYAQQPRQRSVFVQLGTVLHVRHAGTRTACLGSAASPTAAVPAGRRRGDSGGGGLRRRDGRLAPDDDRVPVLSRSGRRAGGRLPAPWEDRTTLVDGSGEDGFRRRGLVLADAGQGSASVSLCRGGGRAHAADVDG